LDEEFEGSLDRNKGVYFTDIGDLSDE